MNNKAAIDGACEIKQTNKGNETRFQLKGRESESHFNFGCPDCDDRTCNAII